MNIFIMTPNKITMTNIIEYLQIMNLSMIGKANHVDCSGHYPDNLDNVKILNAP